MLDMKRYIWLFATSSLTNSETDTSLTRLVNPYVTLMPCRVSKIDWDKFLDYVKDIAIRKRLSRGVDFQVWHKREVQIWWWRRKKRKMFQTSAKVQKYINNFVNNLKTGWGQWEVKDHESIRTLTPEINAKILGWSQYLMVFDAVWRVKNYSKYNEKP